MREMRYPGLIRDGWLAVGATALAALIWVVGHGSAVERPLSDLMLRLLPPSSGGASPFAAAVIDDASAERFGPPPWSRARLAEVVEAVRELGAAGLVVDMLLTETDPSPSDGRLAAALGSGPLVLAASLDQHGHWVLPAQAFGGAAVAAHANAEIESDGVIRSFSETKQGDGLSLESLSRAAARLAGWSGATQPGSVYRPDFRVRPETVPAVSAADLLTGTAEADVIRGRVVFLGVTATGATDQFITPVGRRHRPTPGVLVHASAAASVLRGGLLHPIPPGIAWIAAAFIALFVQRQRTRAGRLRPWRLAAVALGTVIAAVALVWSSGLVLPIILVLLTIVLAAVLREGFESRRVQVETGRILHSLVDEARTPLPAGARDRLLLAKQLQDAVIADRDLRRTLLDGLDEGVVLWDSDGLPLLTNAAFDRLWPEPPSPAELSVESPDDPLASGAVRLERRGRVLEIRFLPMDRARLGVVRDRTAEQELERKRRDMQRLVSHELKTPLASLSGFGALLERYELTGEELRETAGLIRTEADRLGRMVHTFLDLERMESGHAEATPEPLDLAAMVRDRERMHRVTADAKDVTLTIEADHVAPVRGIPERLDQIIDNLIGNAVKYTPEGGSVDVTVDAADGGVRLEVSDTGPGIPADALPHLFERFYRVPGVEEAGSGLGLAVVREVAERHGAQVSVISTPGRGSVFTVVFPNFPAGDSDA